MVERPKDAKPISNKWVFVRKFDKEGNLLKYKARLVAKGCAQRPGYDFDQTFSPVVQLETIRGILAIVPSKQLKMRQIDVKGAYLNGHLQEQVYMRQPEGFDDKSGKVCLLIKTLYGLKQSGREWNKELDLQLKSRGFTNLWSDPCAYIRRHDEDFEVITVWVDNLLLFISNSLLEEKLVDELNSMFELSDLGGPSKIVRIEISQTDNSVTISQKKYLMLILHKEGMDKANPVSMPLDPNMKLEPNPEGEEDSERQNAYALLLGSLQYLSTATRPDITFVVNRLAAYTKNPSLAHYTALKRVLRYLAGTKDYGITYRRDGTPPDNENLFHGYSDAAYANTDDLKSTSGYVFLVKLNSGAITWGSKKQSTITLSTTEAEYVAISEASREAIWPRHLYGELGFAQKQATLLLGDNDGSIAMAKNPQFHRRTKHIELRWHWVRNLVQDGLLDLKNCRNPDQTADVLTKALPKPKHQKHVKELGLTAV